MLCLLGLSEGKVRLKHGFRHIDKFTCMRKDFCPLAEEPLLGALPTLPWSPRYSNQGSHSEQFKSKNWSKNNGIPSTRMSRWRGCSPWRLPQLPSLTSSLDSPCPRLRWIHYLVLSDQAYSNHTHVTSICRWSITVWHYWNQWQTLGTLLSSIYVGLSATIPSLRDCRNIIQQHREKARSTHD